MVHRAGFVSIIGRPNVGKSTLLNALIGEKLSIVTPKAQTTRHRILGILSGKNEQIIFTDTPGIIQPRYKLHEAMMESVHESFTDSDVIVFVMEVGETINEDDDIFEKLKTLRQPIIIVLNKTDLSPGEKVSQQIRQIEKMIAVKSVIPVSALTKFNLDELLEAIRSLLPENPPYYSPDELTDRTERFFVGEIIREKIFLLYQEEIPYSVEVVITEFKEKETLTKITAEIFVNKKTQKPILIGKGGLAIKKLGITAREEIEKFLGRKVFLELTVKIREGWREDANILKRLRY